MFFSNFLGGETRGTKIPISLNINNCDYENVIKIFLLFVSIEASRQYNAILVCHTLSQEHYSPPTKFEKNTTFCKNNNIYAFSLHTYITHKMQNSKEWKFDMIDEKNSLPLHHSRIALQKGKFLLADFFLQDVKVFIVDILP